MPDQKHLLPWMIIICVYIIAVRLPAFLLIKVLSLHQTQIGMQTLHASCLVGTLLV